MDKSIIENNIRSFIKSRPHVFILGAGASKAALPDGDRDGISCPIMTGFLEETGLSHILSDIPDLPTNDNLEDIYSYLYDSRKGNKRKELEIGIRNYFRKLVIPFTPTIYDYLLLSLRRKDYIFSFNWDNLLIQAYHRVYNITKNLPIIYFLHGNIAMGYCDNCDRIFEIVEKNCPMCGKKLNAQPLLYPIKNKNYNQDKSISEAWKAFLEILKECSILSIFGYGAPLSDTDAIESMASAFSSTFRKFDFVEIIDIKPQNQLLDEWDSFLKETNYHVKCYTNLFDSIIAEFPRRSIEGYCQRNFSLWWGESAIKLKKFQSVWELGDWLQPLIDKENNNDYSLITTTFTEHPEAEYDNNR